MLALFLSCLTHDANEGRREETSESHITTWLIVLSSPASKFDDDAIEFSSWCFANDSMRDEEEEQSERHGQWEREAVKRKETHDDGQKRQQSLFSLLSLSLSCLFDEGWRVSSVFLLPFFVFNHNVSPVRCSLVSLLSFFFLFFSLPVLSFSSKIRLAFHVHLTSVSLTSRVIDNTAQSLWDLSPICSLLLHFSSLVSGYDFTVFFFFSSLPLHPDQWSYFCLSLPCLQLEKDYKRIERAGGRIWWKEEDYWSRN